MSVHSLLIVHHHISPVFKIIQLNHILYYEHIMYLYTGT